MNILFWVGFGIVVGIVAQLFDPRPKQGGWLGSILLGILGALLGGFLGDLIFESGAESFNSASFAVASIGAILILLMSRVFRTI